jgi:hypothetical protein
MALGRLDPLGLLGKKGKRSRGLFGLPSPAGALLDAVDKRRDKLRDRRRLAMPRSTMLLSEAAQTTKDTGYV